MRFCKNCQNMYYIRISDKETDSLVYYCRNCGDEDTDLKGETLMISQSINMGSDQKYKYMFNKYTALDPTLPRTNAIRCPNQECESNTKEDVPREVIYLRYDDKNMKYLYVCTACNTTWKTDEVS